MPLLRAFRVGPLVLAASIATIIVAASPTSARSGVTPPPFETIDHVTLNVPDVAKSATWYQSTLGFNPSSETAKYVMLKRGGVTLVLNRATSSAPAGDVQTRPGFYHVAFTVQASQFQASVASLRDSGTPVEAVSDIDHQNAYFKDPDGNILELTASAPDAGQDPAAAVDWLADVLLDHLEATDFTARIQRRLPLNQLPDLSLEGAQQQAQFSRQMLERLHRINVQSLPHDRQLLAGILQQWFQTGAAADQDYWYQFMVTPYAGGMTLQQIHQELSTTFLVSSADRARVLSILDQYAVLVNTIRTKTLAQAQRGIRVSRQALPGVMDSIKGLRESIGPLCDALAKKAVTRDPSASAFESAVHATLTGKIIPAFDSLLAIFDENYARAAPADVGLRTFAGGKDAYRRRIFAETGLTLEPATIHATGLKRVEELELKLTSIRDQLGFNGDKRAFHAMLRTDSRFLAKTPDDVEARYLQHMNRIAPLLPKYFLVLPKAPYGVKRLNPEAEPGMTYGYYNPPSAGQPIGFYYYNGSNLDKRSLVTSAHLIYHELLPGHHLRVALTTENKSQHPLLSVLSFGAYEEGWAEYAANLAIEMGAMPDLYDQYGHYLSQEFLASRLVVDTGMNYLGWPRAKAQRFMLDHSFESDTQIATETLRYSTDIPAQALDYRLGYETLVEGRKRAEKALGAKFDVREFNTAVSNNGAMPLNVLGQQIDWFIAKH